MRATFLAGPLGNSANRSLVETPDPVVIWRKVGALPELDRALAAELDDLPVFGHQFGNAFFFSQRHCNIFSPIRSG